MFVRRFDGSCFGIQPHVREVFCEWRGQFVGNFPCLEKLTTGTLILALFLSFILVLMLVSFYDRDFVTLTSLDFLYGFNLVSLVDLTFFYRVDFVTETSLPLFD